MISAIIIGLLAGYIACLLKSRKNKGLIMYLILGILGSFVGNKIFEVFGFEAYGFVAELSVSVLGSIILLWLWAKVKK